MRESFSTIYTAAKPRDRTDQFVVLAALYELGAERSSVTAKDVGQLLALHLRSKAPANVNGCLRKYKSSVEPAEKGPPLRWRLKEKGIERLRTVSGLSLIATEHEATFDLDVGIVCALEQPELDAVREAFGGASAWREIGDARYAHVYRETTLATDSDKTLRVVATASTSTQAKNGFVQGSVRFCGREE